ncbi:MAG: hypothetical protein JST86_03820 [Bacteroidetes bacterium]|nr:hypothetical protein [Bacteroidota bacterium]
MKKYLIITIAILLISKLILAQTNQVYDSINALNPDHDVTLPVDSFLNAIPSSYTSMKTTGTSKGDKARGLSIYSANGVSIWVQPLNYVYMNRVDPNSIWNLTLFKKEKRIIFL